MNDELLIKLGYNGIEHLVAQLQTLDQYQFPTEPFKPSPSGTGAVWGKITGNLEDQADLIARLDSLQTTIEAAILAEIGNAFTYKGSVATYNELPTEGNKIGDIYNVVETGANYAWDGSGWDKLSETIDLSGYVDKDLFEETLKLYYVKDEVDNLINTLNLYLENKISVEEAARMMDISEVKGLISAESTERETAINGLNTLIQNEVTARTEAIADLDEKITKVSDDLTKHLEEATDDFATKEELSQAVTDLEGADTVLQANIDKVAEDLQKHIEEAETGFITNAQFNAQIEVREQAEATLQTNIDKVASDLAEHMSEAESHAATKAELATEVSARENADQELSDRIGTIEGKDFVEYVDISTEDAPNRKAILLDNHNAIFGKDLNGSARLISMVSKYDVVDFGAKSLHTNLNTKQIVTINDEQAVVTDKNLTQLLLAGDNVEIVKDIIVDPTTQFSYNTFTIKANLSGLETKLSKEEQVRAEADAELQNNINTVSGSVADLDIKIDNHIAEVAETYATKTALSAEETARTEADNLLQGNIDLKANSTDVYTKVETDDLLEKKVDKEIVSDNGKALIFNEVDGGGAKFEGTDRDSFAGVNDMVNGVGVQLYNVDKTTKVGPRITLSNERATYSVDKTELGEEYELAVRKDLTELEKTVNDKVDEINLNLASVFHYKGTVETIDALPTDAKVGDVYNIGDKGYNVVWSGTDWDKLSETLDLEPYDLVADREAADAKIISKIWNQADLDQGYFQTVYNHEVGSYAKLWNENDGGGSQVFDKTANTISYVGTNLEEGNGAADGVNVQIYSKDKTSNEGVRINVNTQKAYYLKGASKVNVAEREIAVKEDVNAIQANMDTLQANVDTSLAHQDGNIQALVLQMQELQSKILDLKSLDYEVVTLYDGSDTDYENLEKSFQLSGEVTANTVVDGKAVTLDEATVYSAYMEMKATEDITLNDTVASGIVYKTNSDAMFKLHADGYVSIRNCTFTPEVAYNGIEIGLDTGLAKSIIIDNCKFDGSFTNHAINVFGLDDGGVITISNCQFHKVANVLRLSNRTNTHWTINLINCTVDEWELGQYAGMILLQDYTSGSKEDADLNNQFAKLTINIQNCYRPDGTKITMPEDLSTICSSGENQVIYMWDEWRNITAYGDKFPTINII